MHHLKIDYGTLRQHNPKLIMVSLSAFGATGPYRNYRAYGSNMEAVVGHALLRGYPDTDPTHNTSVFFADACAGATSAFGMLAALRHRHVTGEGQYIHMSRSENVAHTLTPAVMDYAMNGRVRETLGNRDDSAPQGVYPSAGDDVWLALLRHRRRVCVAATSVGRSEVTDERFATLEARHRNHDAWTPKSAPDGEP